MLSWPDPILPSESPMLNSRGRVNKVFCILYKCVRLEIRNMFSALSYTNVQRLLSPAGGKHSNIVNCKRHWEHVTIFQLQLLQLPLVLWIATCCSKRSRSVPQDIRMKNLSPAVQNNVVGPTLFVLLHAPRSRYTNATKQEVAQQAECH